MQAIIKPFKDAPVGIRLKMRSNILEVYSVEGSRKLNDSEQGMLIHAIVYAELRWFRYPVTEEYFEYMQHSVLEKCKPEPDTKIGWIGKLLGNEPKYETMPSSQVDNINIKVNELFFSHPLVMNRADPVDAAIGLYSEIELDNRIEKVRLM